MLQAVTTSDVLIVSAFRPSLGKDHNCQLVTDSKLEKRLPQLLGDPTTPFLCGDIGYEGWFTTCGTL